jgi:hypothetical protein
MLLALLIGAVVLVGSVVSRAVSALSHSEGAVGTCVDLVVRQFCSALPLSTFETATGLSLPAGTKVVSSTSTGWDFLHHMSAQGVLVVPSSHHPPLDGIGGSVGSTTISPLSDSAAKKEAQELGGGSGARTRAVNFVTPQIAVGWIVQSVSANGAASIYVSIRTTGNWPNAASTDLPAPQSSVATIGQAFAADKARVLG